MGPKNEEEAADQRLSEILKYLCQYANSNATVEWHAVLVSD